MKEKELQILFIDPSKEAFNLIESLLNTVQEFCFQTKWLNQINESNINDSIEEETDIYFLEQKMSKDLTGLEMAKKIRKKSSHPSIFILSEHYNEYVDQHAFNCGVDAYLVKDRLTAFKLKRNLLYVLEKHHFKKAISIGEEQYKNLFERSLNPILILDIEFNIQEINKAAESLFKYTNPKDQSFNIFFEDSPTYNEFKKKLEEKGIIKNMSASFTNKNGDKLYVQLTAMVMFDINHLPIGYQLMIKDMTKEKKSEQRILRAEKISMTGRMARSIAHEVRNPLTNINLALGQLKVQLQPESESKTYIEIIDRSSNRINVLINDLLNSAKSPNLKLKKQSLKAVIENAIHLAKDRIKLFQIKLVEDLKDDVQLMLDELQLKTAVLNIIINAIEAMEKVKSATLSIRIYRSLSDVHLEIKDNGKGMEEEQLKLLFDPFYTGKEKGMGLGLTTTQNIIQQHGGEIDVESQLEKGTTFTISLPKLNE